MSEPARFDVTEPIPAYESLRASDRWPVPADSTEIVDRTVDDAGRGLARWLARGRSEREQIVRSYIERSRAVLDHYRSELVERPGVGEEGLAALYASVDSQLAMIDRGVDLAPAGFRPGICAVIHEGSGEFGRGLGAAIAAVLVSDSVVVIRVSTDSPKLIEFGAVAAFQAGLPEDTVSILHGDAETIDALISHPLVATVLVDGSPAVVQHVVELSRRFGKSVMDYRASPAFP